MAHFGHASIAIEFVEPLRLLSRRPFNPCVPIGRPPALPTDTILSAPALPTDTLPWVRHRQTVRWHRAVQILLMLLGTGACVAAFALSVAEWTPLSVLAGFLLAISAMWISGGAATALIGASLPSAPARQAPREWIPSSQSAIVFTVCGENPDPLAAHLANLVADLQRRGLADFVRVFVLSDTSGEQAITREEAALGDLVAAETISYRRRPTNAGRKPGNIADWFRSTGHRFDYMLVLDADSRMAARRIRTMIWTMETRLQLGLLQAGIALVPGRTGFGRYQRLSARLLSPLFLRGFAATTGATANYWGHNALIRIAAFRDALALPVLSGAAPMGGPILSHDFIEAAWIRRAGWDVEVDPVLKGSAEDAPQTLKEFTQRDRRWCQGNLQHLRLLAEPGLHLLSRAHLVFGILSYLAAPIWLSLLVLLTSGAVTLTTAWPLLPVLLLLLIPKLCALVRGWVRTRTRNRRSTLVRAFFGELIVSTVIAPIIMVRQSGAVLAVLMGRDCGWKRANTSYMPLQQGVLEMVVAIGLCALAVFGQNGVMVWLLPVIGPLLFAPWIIRAVDAPS